MTRLTNHARGKQEEGDVILDLLDRLLMGEKEQKRMLLEELCRLSQNVDGTASHDQIERLVCEAVKQAKRDLGYEEALEEAGTLMKQVRCGGRARERER